MDETLNFFIESITLRNHPLINSKQKTKEKYFTVLSFIVNDVLNKTNNGNHHHKLTIPSFVILNNSKQENFLRSIILQRLDIYKSTLCPTLKENSNINFLFNTTKDKFYHSCKYWRKYLKFYLLCDISIIMLEQSLIEEGLNIMSQFISKNTQRNFDIFITNLINGTLEQNHYLFKNNIIEQYQKNLSFSLQKELRVIVTANMSAGKSTLINALIGKPIARTSQEVCTGNVCYIYNKAFEDGNISLNTKKLILNATENDLRSYKWNGEISIASYFSNFTKSTKRICLIDTPGVNSALYKEHSKITYDALINEKYDFVIYVIAPCNLGTDSEKQHLRWISKNIPKEKVIFVLNKLDDYKIASDNIDESIDGLRKDLEQEGFENPIICPISAYFSLLIKQKMAGQLVSEDENDEYDLFSRKFKRPFYDLSRFYKNSKSSLSDSEEIMLSKRTGMYGLEQIIYGGEL